MAIDPSVLAWEVSRTDEPGRLKSMGVYRKVGRDQATNGNNCWYLYRVLPRLVGGVVPSCSQAAC